MSSTNTHRNITIADLLNEIRKEQAASKAGNTSQRNFTPHYISPASDTVTTSDAASVNPNVSTATDSVTTSDTCSATSYNTGAFVIAEWGDGSDQTNEIKIGFFDIGGV